MEILYVFAIISWYTLLEIGPFFLALAAHLTMVGAVVSFTGALD